MSVFHTDCLNHAADEQYAENTKRNMGWPTIFICPQCSVHLASDYSIQKYRMKRSTSDPIYDQLDSDDDDNNEFFMKGGRYKKSKSGKRNKSKKYRRNKKRSNTRRKKYKKN